MVRLSSGHWQPWCSLVSGGDCFAVELRQRGQPADFLLLFFVSLRFPLAFTFHLFPRSISIFYERAWKGLKPHLRGPVDTILRRRRANSKPFTWRSFFSFGSMDLLVVLSTSTSYFASVAMIALDVQAGPGSASLMTYFDSSVFLIMFILGGRALEAYAKSKVGGCPATFAITSDHSDSPNSHCSPLHRLRAQSPRSIL